MSRTTTILELLAGHEGSASALAAPGRPSLSYAGLRDQLEASTRALGRLGIERGDPVAIVLPNGPEMASAFMSVAACATAAPLNPAYRHDEFKSYLSDLQVRLLVVQEGMDTAALTAAHELGIPIAQLSFKAGSPAGVFELRGETAGSRRAPAEGGSDPAGGEDVALILHTSGTTSRPKIVPLTHRNLCASAANVAECLALRPTDCCMNIMPLFHIHGLVAAVLASLSSGASVVCTPGFNALQFLPLMRDIRPTWFTAVPTMHQAILSRAGHHRDLIVGTSLRLIRSSSAPLPPVVMTSLETTFGVPAIEAYGMTEAAHQITSNPLPPRERRHGSVGVTAGPEVIVMDEAGRFAPANTLGEVAIRGPNVTAGYRNNPEANTATFCNGWLRTGDQGIMDEHGFLRLTGRLKEIINRGGEKISPREVDEVLLQHPAVAQAATFAMPHERLGEDVAAAVVLREGARTTDVELRKFVADHLADMKVPRTIVFLDKIPLGATGKLQRAGLAKQLGLA